MEVNTVHCLFEQSGTFKNQFIKHGIKAYDYDIQNEFGETDCVIDIFDEINKAYNNDKSIFDSITKEDLILAFFPCIYFESAQMMYYDLSTLNYKNLSDEEKICKTIERLDKRNEYHKLLYKLMGVVKDKGLRLIIENPATRPHYLLDNQNFIPPTFIDNNRQLRGDAFKKPTAYWFINCQPETQFTSYSTPKEKKTVISAKKAKRAGLCSMERSLILEDYARNFICDYILNIKQDNIITQLSLDL